MTVLGLTIPNQRPLQNRLFIQGCLLRVSPDHERINHMKLVLIGFFGKAKGLLQ